MAFQLGSTATDASALHQTDVFVSGQDGYNTFRIPAIVQAANGRLLAFAEGRKNSGSDTGDIDLVMKYSNDGGYSWSSLQVVGDNGPNTFGNPAPLVDQSTGRVYLVTTHNLGQDSQSEISSGTSDGTRTVWIEHSDNHGLTWSSPTEITSMVKPEFWRWYATTPGHAIQLERGDKAGRLVVPFNYGQPSHNGAGVIYSDDNGATWQTGGIVLAPTNGAMPSESSAVELTNAQVYLNAVTAPRPSPGGPKPTASSVASIS